MDTTTRRTLWDALVGIAAAVLVFLAVPGVLVAFVGVPLPHHWAVSDVVSWRGLFDLLAVVSWCAWAGCAWPILRSVTARVRSGEAGAGTRLSDRVAVRIALGVLALSSFLGVGAAAGASAAGAATQTVSAPATIAVPAAHAASAVAPVIRAGGSPSSPAVRTVESPRAWRHTVVRGETLASIAAAWYGDEGDWPAIATVNLGRTMDDGTRFVDPSAVSPGWTLLVPTLDADTSPDDTVNPAQPHSGGPPALPLAELAAAGVSALVAGLLARRARQLRRLRAFVREEGEPTTDPVERDADLGSLVGPFERVPLVEAIELAMGRLAGATATADPVAGPVQWVRAGRDGVEVRFSEPLPREVTGWRRTGPATWLLQSGDVPGADRVPSVAEPPWPVLLPLGDDHRGSWLLPVAAGTCVAVVGPRAADFVLAMRAAAATWSWHESLVVTDDAALAGRVAGAAGRAKPRDARAAAPLVLFIGDPGALPEVVRRACAILAPHPVDDAQVTIVVDARAASAHPLGLTVRPPLLDERWSASIASIVDDPTPATDPRAVQPLVHRRLAPTTVRVTHPSLEAVPAPAPAPLAVPAPVAAPLDAPVPAAARGTLPGTAGPVAGQARRRADASSTRRAKVQVRLLTSVPDIVGLQGELPAKRARRAVEVVAYLALHAPDPVTGDRLRTRVLGSSDTDAAAKTLFNTVGAARRALGAGPDGEPLLPPASRSGHYRLSPSVSVDAVQACALLHEGLALRDTAESAARLREGLELVKGEPLGGILTGYAWWRAEGHERRLADAVVDGACALVRLALHAADIGLARWALAQARKVEPYSEALTRAAMQVAAAGGDAGRLHSEWQECRRQMDELDPGGVPSERTERLYVRLRARLSGDAGVSGDAGGQTSFAAIDAAPLRTVPSAPSAV